jgi:hypothetical protein
MPHRLEEEGGNLIRGVPTRQKNHIPSRFAITGLGGFWLKIIPIGHMNAPLCIAAKRRREGKLC